MFLDVGEGLCRGVVLAPLFGGISGAFLRVPDALRMAAENGLRQPLIELAVSGHGGEKGRD